MAISIGQLLAEPTLGLTVVEPGGPNGLDRVVRWVAPTELIDPSPFLRGGELLLTTGSFLSDPSDPLWERYVERLKSSGIAAIGFGIGLVHEAIPSALAAACRAQAVALLCVPYHVAFIQINEFVADAVVANRFAGIRRAGLLAASLATQISNGAPLAALLQQIAIEIDGQVALLDIDGEVLESWPSNTTWSSTKALEALMTGTADGYHVVALDSAGVHDHLLVGRCEAGVDVLQALNSASTLIAIDLATRLHKESDEAPRMATLLSALTNWAVPTDTLVRYLRMNGLSPDAETVVVVAHPTPGSSSGYSLRLRLAIEQVMPTVRAVRSGEHLLLFGQGASDATEDVLAVLQREMPGRRIVVAGPARDGEEIRMVLASARRTLRPDQTQPLRSRTFDLGAIVAAAAGRGGGIAAVEFLKPLVDHDAANNGELMQTLRTFIECDGKPLRTATMLYTHRNTLHYRLDQISRLLNLDLQSLDAKVSCSLAFSLIDSQSPA